jgi:hypothetical protein
MIEVRRSGRLLGRHGVGRRYHRRAKKEDSMLGYGSWAGSGPPAGEGAG